MTALRLSSFLRWSYIYSVSRAATVTAAKVDTVSKRAIFIADLLPVAVIALRPFRGAFLFFLEVK